MTEYSVAWNPSAIDDGNAETQTVTAAGAALGDYVMASMSVTTKDLVLSAEVTSANLITAVLANNTGGQLTVDSGTLRIKLIKATI